MGEVAQRFDITVSAGEQTYTLAGLADLIAARVRMVQPDIVKMGGITGLMRSGALANAHGVGLVPPPTQPNLRQVRLIHAELHEELRAAGFIVSAGQMGENITTQGVDLLGLPAGARLCIGGAAVVEVTGVRNPCAQLDRIHPGLMAATLGRDQYGNLVRKAG